MTTHVPVLEYPDTYIEHETSAVVSATTNHTSMHSRSSPIHQDMSEVDGMKTPEDRISETTTDFADNLKLPCIVHSLYFPRIACMNFSTRGNSASGATRIRFTRSRKSRLRNLDLNYM